MCQRNEETKNKKNNMKRESNKSNTILRSLFYSDYLMWFAAVAAFGCVRLGPTALRYHQKANIEAQETHQKNNFKNGKKIPKCSKFMILV